MNLLPYIMEWILKGALSLISILSPLTSKWTPEIKEIIECFWGDGDRDGVVSSLGLKVFMLSLFLLEYMLDVLLLFVYLLLL